MGLGLLLGAAAVGYRTSLADLALMGALTGLVLGAAQAARAAPRTHRRWVWAAAMPVLWALGWTATTLGGIHVDEQFTVFGAYGAVTFSALSGLLLHRLLPYRADAVDPPSAAHAGRGDGMTTAAARHLRHRRDRPGHLRRAAPPRRDRAAGQPLRPRPGARRRRGRRR